MKNLIEQVKAHNFDNGNFEGNNFEIKFNESDWNFTLMLPTENITIENLDELTEYKDCLTDEA